MSRRTLLLLSAVVQAQGSILELPIILRNTYSLVSVAVGTPSQSYDLLFDTGSSTSWLVDPSCITCNEFPDYNRTAYNSSASSTSSGTGSWGFISYLGGYTSGAGTQDVWAVASESNSATAYIWNQTFLSVYSSTMTYAPADGFLGLAFSTITEGDTETMVETLIKEGVLDSPKFGIYYGNDIDDEWVPSPAPEDKRDGVLTIGGSHENQFVEGEMVWADLEKLDGQYQVWRSPVSAAVGYINGEEQEIMQDGAWIVFDTGSGRNVAPPSVIEELYASIGMNFTAILAGEVIPQCSDFNSSWSVTLKIGSSAHEAVEIEIPGNLFREPGFAYQAEACWPPFDPGEVDGFWLMGTPFLQKVYSVWDFGATDVDEYEPRVGFGKLKEEYLPELLME